MKKKNLPRFKIVLSLVLIAAAAFLSYQFIFKKMGRPKKPAYYVGGPAAPKKKAVATVPVKKAVAGKMAIILDDWGNNYNVLEEAIALKRPITIAILPMLPHSQEIAEDGHAARIGIMLHMPMQPKGSQKHLEPHTIKTTSSTKEITQFLNEALTNVPYVEGVNNHMGSAATSDLRVMRVVMNYLKAKNLFFVDSRVVAESVCTSVARETGIRFGSREVFIDNEARVPYIENQLRTAIRKTLLRGTLIVIGHDKHATLQALHNMIPEIERAGIQLVYARDLVR